MSLAVFINSWDDPVAQRLDKVTGSVAPDFIDPSLECPRRAFGAFLVYCCAVTAAAL